MSDENRTFADLQREQGTSGLVDPADLAIPDLTEQEKDAFAGTVEATLPPSIGVSTIVRLRRPHLDHPAGTVAMVIAQAPNGRNRYMVMVPGDPLSFCPLVADLEVVRGVDPQSWWRKEVAG